jgi:glycyl-tRNA synthetase
VQETQSEARRGPPRTRAYDAANEPTKALLGFCRGAGVDPSSVFFQADNKVWKRRAASAPALPAAACAPRPNAHVRMQGTEYCYVNVQSGGSSTAAVLADVLPDIVAKLAFGRSMRWQPHAPHTFSRPIRWLLALHGEHMVPLRVGGLQSGASTRLLRTSKPPVATVACWQTQASSSRRRSGGSTSGAQ